MILEAVADRYRSASEFSELIARLDEAGPGSCALEGIAPSSIPLVIAALYRHRPRQVLVVTETAQKIQDLTLDLSCYLDAKSLCTIPPWDTLPYEFISPPEQIERERVTALYRLMAGEPCVAVTAIESLCRLLPAPAFFANRALSLKTGEEYPFDDLAETLVTAGYTRERRVEAFGHFTVKGGILDIFLPSRENPVRLDFFGDTLESIREFDPESQVSLGPLEAIVIYPRREMILFEKEREIIHRELTSAAADGKDFPESVTEALAAPSFTGFRGMEDFFPLAIAPAPLDAYLGDDALIIFVEGAELSMRHQLIEKSFHELYERRRTAAFCLPPERLLDTGAYARAAARALRLQTMTATPGALRAHLKSIANFRGRIKQVREEIAARLGAGWRIVVTTAFEGQSRRLMDLLGEFSPASSEERLPDADVAVLITPLREGVEIEALKLMIISDHEIFGKSYRKRRQFKSKTSRPIDSFLDLRPGDLVVHVNHGIGIFRKIERMTAGGVERDFLMIDYADDDKLYVSLDQITMVQKYIGLDGRTPHLDYLGKKSAWNRIKEKVRESVEEIAQELIKIYSARQALKGFQFPPDTVWQEEFEALFEYEETPDQITAIEDVKDDMESGRPMDRLVCGDVGFGKTEVAIRAAFKSVMAGKQVAILVPTTVLAMQHFATFTRRFAGYPITVAMMSRFRTAKELTAARDGLKAGTVDIIVGTHAILSKDMVIKNLGLLVIDEEQRFGVKHKEQLKKKRTMVDVLTLSATPIPRTLHMAMAGIRDLSIIMTPPENRQAIETYVMEDNADILRRAVLHEIERGGQVFYVHNRVQSIAAQAEMLKQLVPEANFAVAHGQMHEHELEDVMIDFLDGKFDVLVSTSIIESGLDIPNVNTIIINRADTFGLSQLYQIKGRVGRSTRQAYAYLFYPPHVALTEEAQKRLQVIAEYADLGSGFKIAMKDLEIRGAGNILGREQSGNIMEVGFELYLQMLDDAVRVLKGEPATAHFRTAVFLKTDFFIPDAYIGDEKQKIEFYKRFEACESSEEIDALVSEMADRFGPHPPEVAVLIELERIRTLASSLGIDEIVEGAKVIRLKITGASLIDRSRLVSLLAADRRLTIDPDNPEVLVFEAPRTGSEKKLVELKKLLHQLG